MKGVWPQGARLEALKLADEFGVSMTPVRDSLNRLAGENLVDLQPGEGYRVPRLSERVLRDLLEVNAELLIFAARISDASAPVTEIQIEQAELADRIAATFAQIASGSSNTVLVELVQALGERLNVVREVESRILIDAAPELETIAALLRACDPALPAALRSYHQRRQLHASGLIAALT
jgi:DNA-binding GntR family transcriptional regulator